MARTQRFTIFALLLPALVGLAVTLLIDKAQQRALPATSSAAVAPPPPEPQLRGRILDASGDTVAGAHVRVESQGRVIRETATDSTGRFALDGLAPGRARVEADHDPEGAVVSADVVLASAPTDLTLVLALASVRGVVVDATDGQPIANVALSIEGVAFAVPSATTDAAGAFRFGVVPFEAASILVVAGGYRVAHVTLGPRENEPELVVRIELRTGPPVLGDVLDADGKPLHAQVVACEGQALEAHVESADDGTFSLPPSTVGCDAIALHDGMAPSDAVRIVEARRTTLRLGSAGAIAGFVVDESGAPIESFAVGVEAFVPVRGPSAPKHGTPFTAGVFRLERLVPGTYVLLAATVGRPPVRSSPIVVRGGAVTDGVRIVLTRGGVVVGRVVDDQHAPLADVELRFDLVSAIASSDAVTKTDATGRYRLEGAPAGPLTLLAQKSGYRAKLTSGIWVETGHSVTKDVVLTATDGGGGMELVGIGANLQAVSGAITFATVFAGDPADRAGLRVGDRVVRIDGEATVGMSVVDAIQRVRGEAGTMLGLTVERDGTSFDVVIPRAALVR